MSSISKIWRKLRDKEYRDGYTEAQLSIEVPFQIRAIRKAHGWTQTQLAERSGIPQARISHIEQPGRDPLSLRTLYRLAAAFDVGLLVQFVPFSELVRREALFNPETFHVPSFEKDRLLKKNDVGLDSKTFRCATQVQFEMKARTTPNIKEHQGQSTELLSSSTKFRSSLPISSDNNAFATERTPYGYKA